jgi:type II secretory pathway predicted ATPase ExeA
MTTTANGSELPSLDLALKTLWGASRWPGLEESATVVAHPAWNETLRRLDQLVGVHASGIVHGPNGVGKSYLIHRWTERLSPKQYRILRLAHSSLMGSDLLRQLVKAGGKLPSYRRGDNVSLLAELWRESAPAWPLVVIDEAQDLGSAALEELRLLTCARADAVAPFSLILCGDEELLGRLELGINRALLSRLGFCVQLERWPADALREYLHQRLAEVGIHHRPFEPPAETLLIQSAQGCPRTVNALLQRSMEQAAVANRRVVLAADLQAALDTLPWLARARSALSAASP